MGSEQSKETSPTGASSQKQHTVNVTITSEVSERWVALAEMWERERKRGENVKMEMKEMKPYRNDKSEVASGSGEAEIGGSSNRKGMFEPDVGEVKDKALFKESAKTGDPKDEENLVTESELPKPEVVADIGGNEKPNDKLPEKMAHFTNILSSGKGSPKLRDDIENFATTAEQYFVPSSHKLPLLTGEEYQLPEYEEVNEMVNIQRDPKFYEMDKDEEEKENLQAEEPMKLREIRIAKAILPVVIDDGDNGVTTVQTITAWQHRERFEEELLKNDGQWAEEMRNLTRKFEDNTVRYAQDVERRIQEIGNKYPDIAASSAGAPCNELSERIGKCYEENKSQRLKCHSLIRQFAQCTNKSIKENFAKV